ncbi:hypothetical protein DSL72_001812 [Monilinia vaccinii-corymbosi]|uniref:Uncharacterized protein n=1 Tax=Monilinia vaccinii-corymbosi TaxID=61207 RepID=A0A8A3PAV8_9HELO|nr:hypothetical protein DSL72_001812 [Monilinia vaccinii-corymbosi]
MMDPEAMYRVLAQPRSTRSSPRILRASTHTSSTAQSKSIGIYNAVDYYQNKLGYDVNVVEIEIPYHTTPREGQKSQRKNQKLESP